MKNQYCNNKAKNKNKEQLHLQYRLNTSRSTNSNIPENRDIYEPLSSLSSDRGINSPNTKDDSSDSPKANNDILRQNSP